MNSYAERHLAVVGGGIMGLGLAWRCARAGMRVTVFEADKVGQKASWAAAGMLAPVSETEFFEDDLLALGQASQRLWPSFAEEVEADSDVWVGYDQTGSLVIAKDRDQARALRRFYQYQESIDLPVEWLTAQAAVDLEPLLSPRIVAAVQSPYDHQVDNRAVLRALEVCAQRAGVEIREETPVRQIECVAGEVQGIYTETGKIEATDVVVAAGAWSPMVEGLPAPPPIRPIKGQMLALTPSDGLSLSHVIRSEGAYLAPKLDRWVLGATSEEMGYDSRVTAGGVYHLLDVAQEIVPAIAELELSATWAGLRPATRDNGPILGGCDIEGLWFCTGHYRNGIQQAPVSIDAVSALILGAKPTTEVGPFALARFAG